MLITPQEVYQILPKKINTPENCQAILEASENVYNIIAWLVYTNRGFYITQQTLELLIKALGKQDGILCAIVNLTQQGNLTLPAFQELLTKDISLHEEVMRLQAPVRKI
jgi:hypothetical protein